MKYVTTIYVTKYALTGGILEQEAEIDPSSRMASFKTPGSITQYYHHGEFHLTMDGAVEKAEDMRKRKIESLKKGLAKLEALSFSARK